MENKLSNKDYQLYRQIIQSTETELKKNLESVLRKRYKKVIISDKYIMAIGTTPIALLAHLDTVFKEPPNLVFYDREQNVVLSPEGGCGDDRVGVFAILKILISTDFKPTIIFTCGEEIGGVGAAAIVKDFSKCPIKNLKYIIQLDRRGTNDCVFYDCDNKKFEKYIESFGFKTAIGSFTDISIICPYWEIAGVNLSIGYFNEHNTSELVLIYWVFETINKVKEMLKDSLNSKNFKYYPKASYSNYGWLKNYYYDDNDNFMYCGRCGKPYYNFEMLPVKTLNGEIKYYCPDCLSEKEIQWCEECGMPFEGIGKFCNDCIRHEKR